MDELHVPKTNFKQFCSVTLESDEEKNPNELAGEGEDKSGPIMRSRTGCFGNSEMDDALNKISRIKKDLTDLNSQLKVQTENILSTNSDELTVIEERLIEKIQKVRKISITRSTKTQCECQLF